jgi:F-box and leucine-rich repeat protein GRR1
MGNEDLERVISKTPNLERLYLRRCKKITDFGIFTMARFCKKLNVLDVSDCGMTEKSIKWISSGGLRIQTLIAKFCIHIDFGNLDKNVLSAKSLRTIKFDFCTQICDVTAISLLSGVSCLRLLSLRGCTKISHASVMRLASELNDLRELDISCCKQLSEDVLFAVSRINPNIVVKVDLYGKRLIGKRVAGAKISREESIKERFTNIPRNVSLMKTPWGVHE